MCIRVLFKITFGKMDVSYISFFSMQSYFLLQNKQTFILSPCLLDILICLPVVRVNIALRSSLENVRLATHFEVLKKIKRWCWNHQKQKRIQRLDNSWWVRLQEVVPNDLFRCQNSNASWVHISSSEVSISLLVNHELENQRLYFNCLLIWYKQRLHCVRCIFLVKKMAIRSWTDGRDCLCHRIIRQRYIIRRCSKICQLLWRRHLVMYWLLIRSRQLQRWQSIVLLDQWVR